MIQSEAGLEPFEGKVAVAYVAINRVEMSGQAIETILRQPRQFAIFPRVVVSEDSWLAAKTVLARRQPDPTRGADHFYNPIVKPWPAWYDERHITARIGRHNFLRLGGF